MKMVDHLCMHDSTIRLALIYEETQVYNDVNHE